MVGDGEIESVDDLKPDTLNISEDKLHFHLKKWEQIGPKWPGSAGENRTKDYIINELDTYNNIDTTLEEFEYLHCSPISSSLKITEPTNENLNCVTVSYYANDSIEGELVYAGSGSEEEFKYLEDNGIELGEKIIMVTNDFPPEISQQVSDYGIKGVINTTDSNMQLSNITRNIVGSHYNCPASGEKMLINPYEMLTDIVGVMVPMAVGHRLLSLLSQKTVEVSIKSESEYEIQKSQNVIGSLGGTERPEEMIVVGSHYDTVLKSPGVWDNGTGVASILEIARSLNDSNFQPEKSIEFVLFGCEENGCWGSLNYSQNRKEALQNNGVAMLTMDPGSSKLTTKNNILASESMKEFVVDSCEMADWRIDEIGSTGPNGDDCAPFWDMGVPTSRIGQFKPRHPYYHTPDDTLEHIDVNGLKKDAEALGLCCIRLATEDIDFS